MVIGIGNPLRGDDAAGLLVARRLRELGVDAVELEGEPLRVLDAWEGAASVAVVDASSSGGPPGTVRRFDVTREPLPPEALPASTHLVGLAEVIELARALERLPPRAVVLAIEGERFETGAAVSAPVAAAVEEAAAALLAEHGRRPDGAPR